MQATTPRLHFPNIVSTWSIHNYVNTERRFSLHVMLVMATRITIFVSANADILLSCAYRKSVSVLIANQRQRIDKMT
jgi:hypothetical protein